MNSKENFDVEGKKSDLALHVNSRAAETNVYKQM